MVVMYHFQVVIIYDTCQIQNMYTGKLAYGLLQISFSKIDYILKVFINLNKYCDIFENAWC